jgi:hypothetical protein
MQLRGSKSPALQRSSSTLNGQMVNSSTFNLQPGCGKDLAKSETSDGYCPRRRGKVICALNETSNLLLAPFIHSPSVHLLRRFRTNNWEFFRPHPRRPALFVLGWTPRCVLNTMSLEQQDPLLSVTFRITQYHLFTIAFDAKLTR